jgi:methylmalonyl-CoA mutase cobalamin-binding subunit
VQAGWQTASDHTASAGTILQTALQQKFDVISISLSSEALLGSVSDLIEQLRKMSRNPHVAIIVCGKLLVDRPELAYCIGGATVALDEVAALDTAETLFRHAPRLAIAHP